MQATYISSNQFKISTDKTAEFLAGRRIRANCGGNYKYSTIQFSIYSDPYTTVTIEENILISNLTEVHYGIVNTGNQGSFPDHSHNGDEGTGGELSLLILSDTPDAYEEGEYLRSTISGVEWTIPEAETVVVRVKEENVSAITKGQVCAVVTGSSGVKAEIGLCDCDDLDKIRILGLAQDNIPQNEDGIVAYKGVLTNVDTRTTNSGINPNGETWTSGDLLWSANSPGGMTNVRPTSGRSIKAARTVKGNSNTDILIIISLENPIWNTAAAGEDVVLRVGDSAGANKVSVRNYNNDEVAAFDSYGNLTLSGTVGGRGIYKTVYIDAAEMIPCTTNGALQGTYEEPTNDIDIDQLAFDGGATPERAQFKIKFPENWDLGTLKTKFDWTGASGCNAGDTVEWRIKARVARDSDVIDAAMGTRQLIVDTIIENNGTDWQTSGATPSLTVGGTPAAGCTVLFEVDRNGPGSDTMIEDALLYGLAIQYKLSGVVNAW